MRIFSENLTLKNIDDVLTDKLKQVKLIGELPLSQNDFEYLAKKVKTFIENGVENELFNKYRASIAAFLVFGAVYYYEGKGYWFHLEKYTGELHQDRRNALYKRFLYILEQLNLPKFEREQEEGYKYVTPIVCHAGIPQSCLDDYFDVVSDTLNNTLFFEGNILDEFKYFMRFKVQKPVIRYFNFLADDGEEFLQDSRQLLLYCDNDNATIEDASIKFSNLPRRMIERCFEWQNTEKAKVKIKTRKNVTITSPKIMLDAGGMGIYVILPQQSIRESFDDNISWEINSDEKIITIKSRLFKRDDNYVSEEKTVALKPCGDYKISLFVEDKLAGTWDYKGLSEGYICFERNGGLIKKSYLPPDIVVIIFDKKHDIGYNDIMIEELPYLPNWTNYKTYRLNLRDTNQLLCSFGSLEVKKDNKPFLVGGKTLFDHIEGTGSFIYTQLPEIFLNSLVSENFHINVTLKHDKSEVNTVRGYIANGTEKISLKNYIEPNAFGEYDITIWNLRGNQGRFYIKYVPEIEFYYEKNDFWPSGNKGYVNNDFYCRYSKAVTLEFENATYVGNVLINGRDYTKFIFNNVGRYVHGKLAFLSNDIQYVVPVKKNIRPVMWGFMGLSNDVSIIWDSVPKTFSMRDLQSATDANLIISVDDTGFENVKLNVSLYSNNKRKLNSRTINADNYSKHRISVNSFLTDMQAIDESNFNFILELKDSNDEKICECLIAKVQEDIIYSDLTVLTDDHNVYFNWSEQGSKMDRELVLYNCYMPWEPPQVFSIENWNCGCQVELDGLVDSMYGIKIRNVDDFSFFDTELEIPKITHRTEIGKAQRTSSGIKQILYDMFKVAYSDYPIEFVNGLNEFRPEFNKEDIEALCVSYLFYVKNSVKNDLVKTNVRKIYIKLFTLYSRDKYKVLKTMIDIGLKKDEFIKLALEFNMLSLKIDDGCSFSPVERDMLWNYMPELAFMIDIRIKATANRICNRIGDNVINELVTIKEDCTVRDCLSKVVSGECNCDQLKFKLSEDVLGSFKHKTGFFEYLSKEYFSAQRLEKLDDMRLFRTYEQHSGNSEVKIFGKSYFLTVQEWISSINGEMRKKVEEDIKKVFDRAVDRGYVAGQFPLIHRALSSRIDSDQMFEYYVGMIVFINCLYQRGLLNCDRILEKGVTYLYRRCHALFVRDLVVLELFLTFGGVR